MQFDSWSAFFDMGGYGLYVWLSFAVTLVVMLGLVFQTRASAKSLRRDAALNEKRQSRIKQAMEAKQ